MSDVLPPIRRGYFSISRESLSSCSCSLTKLVMIFSSSCLMLLGRGRGGGRRRTGSTYTKRDDRSLTGPMRMEFNSSELKVRRGLIGFLGVTNGDFSEGDSKDDCFPSMAKTSARCLAVLYLYLYFSFAADCSSNFYSISMS